MGEVRQREELPGLHARLLNGDRVASELFARAALPRLVTDLARTVSAADPHDVEEAAIDAVLDHCAQPNRFDPARGTSLDAYLRVAARRNLLNIRRGHARRKRRERVAGRQRPEADVALDPAAGNIRREDRERLESQRTELLAALTDGTDRAVLGLILDGVRDTATFAPLLGVADRPVPEQRAAVKRCKDRIVRYLRRRGLMT